MDATPISYSVRGAVTASSYSRSRLYQLIAEGKLDVRKDGRKTLITAESLRDYIYSLPSIAGKQEAA